eukprot:3157620-Rhodomonas_salina.1
MCYLLLCLRIAQSNQTTGHARASALASDAFASRSWMSLSTSSLTSLPWSRRAWLRSRSASRIANSSACSPFVSPCTACSFPSILPSHRTLSAQTCEGCTHSAPLAQSTSYASASHRTRMAGCNKVVAARTCGPARAARHTCAAALPPRRAPSRTRAARRRARSAAPAPRLAPSRTRASPRPCRSGALRRSQPCRQARRAAATRSTSPRRPPPPFHACGGGVCRAPGACPAARGAAARALPSPRPPPASPPPPPPPASPAPAGSCACPAGWPPPPPAWPSSR